MAESVVSSKSKLAHTVKTQVHIRTCGRCGKTGERVAVVLLLYAKRKLSGAVGQGRAYVHRCPKCLGGTLYA
jgi:DnaJ-class molecular chaperone